MKIILAATDEALASAWEDHCGHLSLVEVHRGSILDLECDAVVSPANSFGFMDGGIDLAYTRHFGRGVQERVQDEIRIRYDGELLVGQAVRVVTDDARIPHLIAAPTMRVPTILGRSVNPYLAARAVFRLVREWECYRYQQANDAEVVVAFPGLGTGVGQVPPGICAYQMRLAIDARQRFPFLKSIGEASRNHQAMYGDDYRDLQQAEAMP